MGKKPKLKFPEPLHPFMVFDPLNHEEDVNCWCEPILILSDPEDGEEVYLHREVH